MSLEPIRKGLSQEIAENFPSASAEAHVTDTSENRHQGAWATGGRRTPEEICKICISWDTPPHLYWLWWFCQGSLCDFKFAGCTTLLYKWFSGFLTPQLNVSVTHTKDDRFSSRYYSQYCLNKLGSDTWQVNVWPRMSSRQKRYRMIGSIILTSVCKWNMDPFFDLLKYVIWQFEDRNR